MKNNQYNPLFFRFYFLVIPFLVLVLFAGCDKEESIETGYTGNSIVYQLVSGSEYNISGTATFREKKDGTAEILIDLDGVGGSSYHPVHLHYGSVDEEGELAALLYPVYDKTGESITELNMLADESSITYQDLLRFNGSIRVHLDDGANKNIILAYNNIGANRNIVGSMSSRKVVVCKGY